ncbi:hypothetical protein [Qipengyuania marisflavi]|uniref:Uncharacterized protein n=1 Tax=Qipengyuania marisflavi TaxID=2486356 RepID=A0A5S3P8R6_9SPHN|nr:hypothetical protein [Qipengyuania marisflavi]TMM48834.1 hypothetical protein FEV51_05425 [Qipengyuania marisflavi]
MDTETTTKTPWHLWLIGALATAWNAIGPYDYIQTQTGNLDYFKSSEEMMGVDGATALAYFQDLPAWIDACWALGVWGALIGSILLLLRSRYAVWSFAISLFGLAGSTFGQLARGMPEWASGGSNTIFTIVIWSIATFLLIYAVSMRNKGVLR